MLPGQGKASRIASVSWGIVIGSLWNLAVSRPTIPRASVSMSCQRSRNGGR